MVDFAALNAERKRVTAFLETELGQLYIKAIRATESYWKEDANERISDMRLRELDEVCRKAQLALREKLMELAGV